MPHTFRQPVINYRNPEEFAELAIKTLNHTYGKHKPNGKREDMHTFDFSVEHDNEHNQDFYVCVGYFKKERLPAAQAVGSDLSEEQLAAIAAARVENVKAFLQDVGIRVNKKTVKVNATEGAIKFASVVGIDLTKVKGTGADGKVTQPDVQAYQKANAPEKDKAAGNGANGQQ